MLRTLARRVRPLADVRPLAAQRSTSISTDRWSRQVAQARWIQSWQRDATSRSHTLLPTQRCFSSTDSTLDYTATARSGPGKNTEEIERVPLPPGISGDKFELYDLAETSKDWGATSGCNAVLSVHGPEELWAAPGGNEGASGGMFAVIAAGGSQHKVCPGDVLYINRVAGDINERVRFEDVLLVGAYDWTVWGRPLIRTASVLATVEEQTLTGKVIVAKFKKRKGYRRKKGHRQPITRLRIDEIVFQWPAEGGITLHKEQLDPRRPPPPSHAPSFF